MSTRTYLWTVTVTDPDGHHLATYGRPAVAAAVTHIKATGGKNIRLP